MGIRIEKVSKVFSRNNVESKALENINFNIDNGEFVCLLGPSGCGKSTLLNLIAGFTKASKGKILIDDKEVEKPRIERVTIFQNYGLLPWRDVEKNVQLGLETLKIPKEKRKEISDKYIKLVGLEEFKKRYPSELSGGQQQRVAIARALATKPKILFMDEPFSALDPITRYKLQEDMVNIWKEEDITIIFVTHDVEESVFLGSKIVIMSPHPGRVKHILTNKLEKPINRNDTEFYNLKDRIFHLLEQNATENVEYYI
ncbi:MAG: ABC transporter ATP-binding protein [Clostridium sp.]|nr:ABC transporter ATP-binding protein [Clostridium sp.]